MQPQEKQDVKQTEYTQIEQKKMHFLGAWGGWGEGLQLIRTCDRGLRGVKATSVLCFPLCGRVISSGKDSFKYLASAAFYFYFI